VGTKKIYVNEEKNYKIIIDESRCKGCGLCIIYCPKDVLELSTYFSDSGYRLSQAHQPEKCIACRKCELTCPDFAIYILKDDKTRDLH